MIQETAQELRKVFLYIKAFEYSDVRMSLQHAGHPTAGKIYRAVQNTNDKIYRVFINDNNALIIDKLISDDAERGYISKIHEITPNTILDLKLEESDLDLLLSWTEGTPNQLAVSTIKKAMEDTLQQDFEFAKEASETLTHLNQINSTKAHLLIALAALIIEDEMYAHEDAAYQITMSPDRSGLGLNIGRTLEALSMYASTDVKVGNEEGDLIAAITHLITEWSRRIENDLE